MTTTQIVVSGEIRINPEDFDAAIALIEPLVVATNGEAGCIAYDFWVDPRDRGRVRVFEEWESAAANQAHSESTHLATFYAAMATLRIESLDLSWFEVSLKRPLEI